VAFCDPVGAREDQGLRGMKAGEVSSARRFVGPVIR